VSAARESLLISRQNAARTASFVAPSAHFGARRQRLLRTLQVERLRSNAAQPLQLRAP
jgi:hypothetical protein